ncbi:MAG: hypothetical protein IJ079_06445 [Lachnospiraceae bacterium]|nr:hypothetical protein [Lachnospiraceae bacterium]MBR1568430.1 hypothetical protein [Lachnospiraceae bacterium]
MSRLILCENRQAVVPYTFMNTKVEVYSYEELCFYIYNNVALLYPEQFGERFVQWLRTELAMNELADRVFAGITEGASLNAILVTILSGGQYYDQGEIQHFLDKQELAALLSEEEKLKLKADSFLMYKRFLKAISLYDEILRKENEDTDQRFIGDVYHNKGVALAKNMELSKAKLCFLEAYNRNQKKPSLEGFVMLRILEEAGGSDHRTGIEGDASWKDIVWKEAEAFGMEEADYHRLIMVVEDAVDDAENTGIYARYRKAIYNKEHGDYEAFNQRVDMLLNQWKEEFREQVI